MVEVGLGLCFDLYTYSKGENDLIEMRSRSSA